MRSCDPGWIGPPCERVWLNPPVSTKSENANGTPFTVKSSDLCPPNGIGSKSVTVPSTIVHFADLDAWAMRWLVMTVETMKVAVKSSEAANSQNGKRISSQCRIEPAGASDDFGRK